MQIKHDEEIYEKERLVPFLLSEKDMDAIQLLTQRRSIPRLLAPAPSEDDLKIIIDAGLRAPDHGALTPWEFNIAQGEGLHQLSKIFTEAVQSDQGDQARLDKASQAPYRAPMVITVIARTKIHAKVPIIEQILSAACATQAMQMAAVALGYQGFWRTGPMTYHPFVREAFKVDGDDQIVGFLYLGTADCSPASPPQRNHSDYVTYLS